MVAKVQRWGNSLGIRIPKAFAQEVHLEADAEVDLLVEDGRLVVRPRKPATYRLESLLAAVTRENLHDEVGFGGPAGRELL